MIPASRRQYVTMWCRLLFRRKRIKRRVHFEEDLSMGRLGTTRLQVVDQCFAHFVGQRQAQGRARFRLRDFYRGIFPMKMIEFQCANVPGTQSQPACQQENGVISFAFRRTAIDRPEKPDDEFVIPNRRDTCIPGNTDFWQLRTEILLENPTHGQKPKKRTHIRDDSRDGVRSSSDPDKTGTRTDPAPEFGPGSSLSSNAENLRRS